MDDLDWLAHPATYGWIEAIGTAGAFIAAVIVLARQGSDRRREQASKVSATFGGATQEGTGQQTVKVTVLNSSAQPIYDVFGLVYGHEARDTLEDGSGDTIPAGDADDILIYHVDEDQLGRWRRVGVQFTDSAGRHWTRRATGRLVDRTRTVKRLRFADRTRSPLLRWLTWRLIFLHNRVFGPDH